MESPLAVFFLGLIALAVLAMAVGQVLVFVMAARAMSRMSQAVSGLERDMRPVVANLQAMSADAARASAQAAEQVIHAGQLLGDVSTKIEETVESFQRTILTPARDGLAVLQGIRAALSTFRDLRPRRRAEGSAPVAVPDPGDEDHASFIG